MDDALFVLQWHITALCDQRCKHCYMHDSSTFRAEIKNTLDLIGCKKIIDDFVVVLDQWNMHGRINFTGGDPILRKDFYEIVEYAHGKGIEICVLGNPYHINSKSVKRLKACGVSTYQISLDGMQKIHDLFRRPGSFDESIRALKLLKKNKIRTAVMFTLSKENSEELLKVINLVSKMGVDFFDFARIVPIGTGRSMLNKMLSAEEYRYVLFRVFKEYLLLKEKNTKTKFNRKEHLWNLLYQEIGLFYNPTKYNKKIVFSGCRIGMNLLTILPDGTVYGCRRLPIKIGSLPEQAIRDIFVNSKMLNQMRNIYNFKKCKKCDLVQFCRGCPSISYAVNRDYFSADPQCWKK